MSPIVFKFKSYRFLFFPQEERRMHIHVLTGAGGVHF